MKTTKRWVSLMAAAAGMGLVGTVYAATDHSWTWPADGTGNSVTNMADWTTAANWTDGVPQTSDDQAYLTNAFTGVKFVKIPGALTFGRISGVDGKYGFTAANRQIVVCDEVTSIRPSGDIPGLGYVDFYGDVSWAQNKGYFNACTLAGDICEGSFGINTTLSQRLDLYAKQAGGVRRNFLPANYYLRESWGNYTLYAPKGTSADVVGQWTCTAGSPYLLRTGAVHDISVGTTVHGTGIPEGAWVKRVFTDGVIEISAAATETVEDGDVTFDAMSVDVYMRVSTASRAGAGDNFIVLNKHRSEDVLRFEIDTVENSPYPFPFRTDNGYYPGTFVLHNLPSTTDARKIVFYNCHIEFAPATGGNKTGMAYACAKMVNATDIARFTVTNNISASILAITNLVGTVKKDGVGALKVGLSRLAARNTGAVVVEEGTFEVACENGNDAYVKTLAVSNGAVLRVTGGNVKVDNLILEPGAKIKGPGHVLIPQIKVVPSSMLEDGAAVEYVGPAATVYYQEGPATNVVGNPALWMDVSQPGAVTYDPTTLRVSALADVRGAGYMTATVPANKSMPTLVTNVDGTAQHIYFACKGGTTTRNLNEVLGWDKPLTNVRVIFKVLNAIKGGGNLLGALDSNHMDFWRDEWTTSATGAIFFTGNSGETARRPAHVTNGVLYVNGEYRDWHTGYGYAGGGGSTGKSANQYVPLLAEYDVPAPGGYADCFSYVEGGTSRTGNERLYEVIVYTNELTLAERQAVTGYLMKKYKLGEVDISQTEENLTIASVDLSADQTLGVGAGSALRVNATTGNGAFVKEGDGTLYVDEYANAAGSLSVADGKLTIRSLKLDSAMAGTGAYLHLDALNEDSVTVTSGKVTAWADTRGAGYPSATGSASCIAYVTNNCLNGKRMVDLNKTEGGYPYVLQYPACSDFKSVIMVTGTRQWGGVLIGHKVEKVKMGSNGQLYGLWRSAGGTYGTNITPDTLMTQSSFSGTGWAVWEQGAGASHARINGVDVNPFESGVTHEGDLVSFVTREPIYGDTLSCVWSHTYNNDNIYYAGGQQLGEYLLFRESLSQEHVRRIEAYLRQKWFGQETVGYRAAQAARVDVAAGATLELVGGAPITVTTLSGAGTISGSVAFAANTVFEVPVAADGSVPLLTINGTADLSAGGTVRLVGSVGALKPGTYPILAANGISAAALADWTLTVDGTCRRVLRLAVDNDGRLVLCVSRAGTTIMLR